MLPNPYLLLGAGLLTLALMFGAYRHGVSTTETRYNLVIERGRADAEKATREAIAKAREYERSQRDAMAALAAEAVAKAHGEVNRLRKANGALARQLQEAANDPAVDEWNRTSIPRAVVEPVERLYPPSGETGSGGGGAISLPPDPSGTAGSL